MPNRAAGLSPWAARERLAQRSDRRMDSATAGRSAGHAVHSSNTIATSEPSARWTSMERSGSSRTGEPS